MIFEGTLTSIFLLAFTLKMMTKFYLDFRNLDHIVKNRSRVPVKFANKISLEDHQKAADYARSKTQFNRFGMIVDAFFLIYWTVGGGLNVVNEWALKLSEKPIFHGLIAIGIFSLINMIISLPQSWFSQFVIEEKFGFNKSSNKIFFTDFFKQFVLTILIGGPVVATLFYIIDKLGPYWWLYAWGFLSSFQFFIVWAYPTIIAPMFNKFSPLDRDELKEKIEVFLGSVSFPFTGLFVMDASRRSSHGNAYFTGFGKAKRIVFFDTLIDSLEDEEVIAVLAHEIGHYKKKHILKSMIKSLIFSLLSLYVLSLCLKWPLFYTDHGVSIPNLAMGFMLFLLVSPVYTFCLTPINSLMSRKNEYEADQFAHENANSKKLISALVKMYKDNASTLTPDPMYSQFYHSHPPALERIDYLEKLAMKNA